MNLLTQALKKLFTIPQATGKYRPRIFLDSASFNPKTNRHVDCAAILTACNEAESIINRVKAAQEKFSSVIVIDQGSTDSTPYLAAEAGAMIILMEPNLTYAQAMLEATRLARRSASNILFID